VNLNFEGYEIIVVNGTKKFRKGQASGGFVVLIKQHIFKYVEILKNTSNYSVWLKFSPPNTEAMLIGFILYSSRNINNAQFFKHIVMANHQ